MSDMLAFWTIVITLPAWLMPYVPYIAYAAMAAGAYAVSRMLAPRPPGQGSTPLDTSRFPSIEEGKPYSVLFGTKRQDGYDTAWSGDTKIYEKERSDAVAYRYFYAGAHLIYCQGPVDGCKQLWYGDAGGGKCAWPTADDPTVFAADGLTSGEIDAVQLFGSPYDGGTGGVKGDVDILLGTAAQGQNAYLAAQIDSDVPAYRGLASIVCKRINWGCQSFPQVLGAVWKRITIEDDGAERWYLAKAAVNTHDLNVAHVLHECLTNTRWGERLAAADLGDTWEAVADTLYDEGAGVSCYYCPEPGNLRTFVNDLLAVIDAVLYDDPVTGQLQIALIRDDYEVADLPHYSEDDFTITARGRSQWRDVPGRLLLKYTDRLYAQQGASVEYIDPAVIAKQGGRVAEKVLDYQMIADADFAAAVVNRKGRAATAVPHAFTLAAKRTVAAMRKGSVFYLTYADPLLPITSMVVRVVSVNYGSSDDERMTLTVVEDVYSQAYTVVAATPASTWTDPTADHDTGYVYTIQTSEGNAATVNATAPA